MDQHPASKRKRCGFRDQTGNKPEYLVSPHQLKLTSKASYLGQEWRTVLQPPLAADEHHLPAALRCTVYCELEKERGLAAVLAARGRQNQRRRG
jgi:hypothetical protein